MAPITYQYQGGNRKTVLAPKVYTGSQAKEIVYGWLYTNGQKELVFNRTPVDFQTPVLSWNSVALSWLPPGLDPDSYNLKRTAPDQVTLSTGNKNLSYTDTNRLPSTNYSYLVEAIYQGAVQSSDTITVTTPARGSMDLTAASVTWQSLTLNWTDPAGGATGYRIYQDGVVLVNSQTAKTLPVTGLNASTAYVFKVAALNASNVEVGSDTLNVTTPVRPAMTLKTNGTVYWDYVPLIWTDPGGGATSYKIYRDNVFIISQAGLTWADSLRFPSTTYTYKVEALRNTQVVGSISLSVATPAKAAPVLTATAASYSSVNLSWTDSQQRSVDNYKLYRGSTKLYDGSGKSDTDTGLSASTKYDYVLHCYRSGSEILPTDGASATTPARPTSSGSVYGPAHGSGYYWTQSTAKTLPSTNFNIGRDAYVTSFNLLVSGYGTTGSMDPYIDGTRFGWRDLGSTGAGSPGWSNVSTGNHWVGNGAHSIGCYTGNQSPKKTQWKPYSGGGSDTCIWGQVNYWYYSASWVRTKGGNYVNTEDDPHVIGEHLDTWTESACDNTGKILYEKVYIKETRELIHEWDARVT